MRAWRGGSLRGLLLVVAVAAATVWLGEQFFSFESGEEQVRSGAVLKDEVDVESLVMVFIGSATCASSRSDQVRRDLATTNDILRMRASEAGLGFHRVGVAESGSAERGIEFLREAGDFDEIVAGGGWTSTGMMWYVVEQFPGPDMTPQVVVLRRYRGVGGWGIEEESLLLRLVGAEQIGRWVNAAS